MHIRPKLNIDSNKGLQKLSRSLEQEVDDLKRRVQSLVDTTNSNEQKHVDAYNELLGVLGRSGIINHIDN